MTAGNLTEYDANLARLERLSVVTREVMSQLGTMSLGEQMQRIAVAARDVLEAEACAIFLVKENDETRDRELSLEASFGHRDGGFKRGKRLPIINRAGGGLTSHIAAQGVLFNECGSRLFDHPAVADRENLTHPHHTKRPCHSLLAMPLKRLNNGQEELVGLLRADNKLCADGETDPRGFDGLDARIIQLFAEAAVAAIENAELVHYRASLIGSCPTGIVAVDRDGLVTELNRRAAEILERSRDEVLRKPIADLFLDPLMPRKLGKLLHIREGRLMNERTVLKGPAGEPIPIVHSATWLMSGDRRVGSLGYFDDLRPQLRLQRSEQLLQAMNSISSQRDLTEGLQHFTRRILQLVGRWYCGVLLADGDGEALSLRAASRSDQPTWRPPRHIRIVTDEWPGLRETLAAGRPQRRTSSDGRVRANLRTFSHDVGLEFPIESMFSVPLKIGDRIVGQVDLGERRHKQRDEMSPQEEADLLGSAADQVALIIDRVRLLEETKHREIALRNLARVACEMRAETGSDTLVKQIAQLALDLVDYEAAGVFLRDANTGTLVLKSVRGLPGALVGIEAEPQELIWRTADEKKAERASAVSLHGPSGRVDIHDVLALPLLGSAGDLVGVLFVGKKRERDEFESVDEEILERFAFQATLALQTSTLLSEKHRIVGPLDILHRITDYILKSDDENKPLHAFLTGVTAGYGLQFNRAFLFLVDDSGKYLVGKRGIGEIDAHRAEAAWRGDDAKRLHDFHTYLELLNAGKVEFSTIDRVINGLRLPLGGDDVLAQALNGATHSIVEPRDFGRVPQVFLDEFAVTSPFVVVPLVTSTSKPLGLLIADNKFTQLPIESHTGALIAFASTAAIALENRKLLADTRQGERLLLSFYEMSGTLAALTDPDQILHETVEKTFDATDAWGVSLLLADFSRQFRAPIAVGADTEFDVGMMRSDPRTADVLRTGEAVLLEDIPNDDANAKLRERGVKAAICVPLSVAKKTLGVMWIHYDRPRRFPQSLLGGLQLFVKQAAAAYDQAHRIQALERIRAAAESLAGIETVDGVLGTIVETARKVFGATSAVLWLYDPHDPRFLPERSTATGIDEALWDDLRARGVGASHALMARGWVAVPDINGGRAAAEPVDAAALRLVHSLGSRAFQAVPLKVGTETLGILYTIYRDPAAFSEDQHLIAEEFANHAAWSLKKARLLERVVRAKAGAKVVAEIAATGRGDHNEILATIAEHAREALGCDAVVLIENGQSGLAHPPATAGVRDQAGINDPAEKNDYDLVESILHRDDPRLVPRVLQDPDFSHRRFVKAEGICSCAAIPLRASDHAVGVMFINYRVEHDFANDEVDDITLFAHQTAVAIRAAQLFDTLNKNIAELGNARALARARTEVAWIGLTTLDWSHDVQKCVGKIQGVLSEIKGRLSAESKDELVAKAERAQALVSEITRPPLPEYKQPDQSSLDVESQIVRPFYEACRRQIDTVALELSMKLSEPVAARANAWWVHRALSYVVMNAHDHAFDGTSAAGVNKITISVLRNDGMVEIHVTDNGSGIPPNVLAKLFLGPIEKAPDAPGLGIGLLITKSIMEIFGGSVHATNVEPTGASIVLSLPIVSAPEKGHV